jgi:hypothetical protein
VRKILQQDCCKTAAIGIVDVHCCHGFVEEDMQYFFFWRKFSSKIVSLQVG